MNNSYFCVFKNKETGSVGQASSIWTFGSDKAAKDEFYNKYGNTLLQVRRIKATAQDSLASYVVWDKNLRQPEEATIDTLSMIDSRIDALKSLDTEIRQQHDVWRNKLISVSNTLSCLCLVNGEEIPSSPTDPAQGNLKYYNTTKCLVFETKEGKIAKSMEELSESEVFTVIRCLPKLLELLIEANKPIKEDYEIK